MWTFVFARWHALQVGKFVGSLAILNLMVHLKNLKLIKLLGILWFLVRTPFLHGIYLFQSRLSVCWWRDSSCFFFELGHCQMDSNWVFIRHPNPLYGDVQINWTTCCVDARRPRQRYFKILQPCQMLSNSVQVNILKTFIVLKSFLLTYINIHF